MRGLKAKTMRRVARQSKMPAPTTYKIIEHRKTVLNPLFGKTPVAPMFIEVTRRQVVLGPCERQMVQTLKRRCPKGSFFGMALDLYRHGGVPKGLRNATIQVLEAPPQ